MICFVIGLAVFSVTMTNSDIEFLKDDPAAVLPHRYLPGVLPLFLDLQCLFIH